MSKITKKSIFILLLIVSLQIYPVNVALPFVAKHDEEGIILIKENEVINDDLYIVGDKIIINGIVNGDVLAAGNSIIINGYIRDSAMTIAKEVTISGKIGHGLRIAGFNLLINGTIGKDLLIAGSKITLSKSAIIGGSVLFAGTELSVNGLIKGNIMGSGSLVNIQNKIMGSAQIKAKHLTLMQKAYIGGNLTYTSENEAKINPKAKVEGIIDHKLIENKHAILARNASFILMNTFIKQGFRFLPLFL